MNFGNYTQKSLEAVQGAQQLVNIPAAESRQSGR